MMQKLRISMLHEKKGRDLPCTERAERGLVRGDAKVSDFHALILLSTRIKLQKVHARRARSCRSPSRARSMHDGSSTAECSSDNLSPAPCEITSIALPSARAIRAP